LHLDKDRIKESLTEEEIHKILNDLGSKDPIMGNQYQTICHGGHKHKLYYYHDSKSFHCYTDCSENMDIFEVVVRAKGISFPQAVQYVAAFTGKTFGFSSIINNSTGIINDWEMINRYKKKEKIATVLPEYDSKVMDVFLPYPHESWINEGISYETQKKFNVSYYIRDERIILPHYDLNNRLVGIRGRAMKKEDIEAGKKYMPVTVENTLYNHTIMMNLYGLNKTKEAIKRLGKVAIFEGEKSVLKCEDYYGDNNFSVACCSSSITNFHRDLLLSLGIEEVIICFDKFRAKKEEETDEKYEEKLDEYQQRLLKLAQKFTSYVRTYIVYDDFGLLPEKSSPVDKGKNTLEQLMKCKYEINTINEVE
jgi:DNA primase